MKLIENNYQDTLQHIIAVYNHHTVCYEVENNTGNTGKLSAGKPLTEDSAKSMFDFLSGKTFTSTYGFTSIIPENVVHFKHDTPFILWYTLPSVQKLSFKDKLPVKTGYYPIPMLLWKLSKNSLSVFALKEKPTNENVQLYQAPFLNVSDNGSVCMGSAKLTTTSKEYDKKILKAQQAFYNSTFTHTNTNQLIKGNIFSVLQEQQEKKSTSFPNSLLLETNYRLKQLF